MKKQFCITAAAVLCACLPLCAGTMKKYEAKYHIIYTDLPKDDVIEAVSRMNAIDEQYYYRTKGFSGKITRKLPLYIYSKYSDYVSAGGVAGSAGVYTGRELRAAADASMFPKEAVWHTVQHEGFHQFVHMVITAGKQDVMPIWLNEGMAEYFGEARWTGEQLIPGYIYAGDKFKKGRRIYTRSGRLQRVQESIKKGEFKPLARMVTLSHQGWNAEASIANYDQAWSMVHFFVHAQDAKGNYIYRQKFQKYIESVVKGNDNAKSFSRFLGNPGKIQKEYENWWLSWKTNPAQDTCDRILIETLVNFMARADVACRMRFEKPEDFFTAAKEKKIEISGRFKNLWLPQGLLDEALKQKDLKQDYKWEIKTERKATSLVLIRPDGSRVECMYKTRGTSQPLIKTTFISPDNEGKSTKDDD